MSKRSNDPDDFDPEKVRHNNSNSENDSAVKNQVNGVVIRYEFLGIISLLIIQTMGGVWWGSSLTTKLNLMSEEFKSSRMEIKEEIKSLTEDRYTAKDALRDFAMVHGRIDKAENRIGDLEKYNRKSM